MSRKTQRVVLKSQAREIISKVYDFMKKEANNNYAEKITDARWRTAQAVGVSESTVTRILSERKAHAIKQSTVPAVQPNTKAIDALVAIVPSTEHTIKQSTVPAVQPNTRAIDALVAIVPSTEHTTEPTTQPDIEPENEASSSLLKSTSIRAAVFTSPVKKKKRVESSAAASVHYKPTLWYYKHLNFLSGNKDPDSDDSDSDHNDDTVYVQLPRGQKKPASTSDAQEGESDTSIDASAAAFGRSVGAQLHHLSKMQRCIAEKLISDVIYHAKMEQLSLDTTIDVKETADDQVNILIPEAGPSWYETDTALNKGGQESSSSCKLLDTTEDLIKKEIAETESAVNFIKMERDETENYYFQDDEDEQTHAIDIIKEELL